MKNPFKRVQADPLQDVVDQASRLQSTALAPILAAADVLTDVVATCEGVIADVAAEKVAVEAARIAAIEAANNTAMTAVGNLNETLRWAEMQVASAKTTLNGLETVLYGPPSEDNEPVEI